MISEQLSTKIIGDSLPNMPWQEKPKGYPGVVWRYSANPIIPRDICPNFNSVFNSAAVPFNGGYRGVFRCDDISRNMGLNAGKSKDGINWEINPNRIKFVNEKNDPEIARWDEGYDPRVVKIEDKYYVTWCNVYHGPTIGMAWTTDFETFNQLENVFPPFNRNGVLFPRKINGKFAMVHRPSDNAHTAFGDIFYSESPDLEYWGHHRYVMGRSAGWQSTKIGPGPAPIETTEGWLLFYHGVLNSCNGFVYSMGAAILDIDEPWKVKYRTIPYLLNPRETYECVGDVPNVCFPCAALTDADTGRIAIYYGCADTVTGLAFAYIDELVDYVKANSRV